MLSAKFSSQEGLTYDVARHMSLGRLQAELKAGGLLNAKVGSTLYLHHRPHINLIMTNSWTGSDAVGWILHALRAFWRKIRMSRCLNSSYLDYSSYGPRD